MRAALGGEKNSLGWLLWVLCMATNVQDARSGSDPSRRQSCTLVALKDAAAGRVIGRSFYRQVKIIAAGLTIMLVLINSFSLLYTSPMSMETWFVPAAMSLPVVSPASHSS